MNRFTDTDKWKEDWYCLLKGEYQKLWDYICDHCDNAGIWKPNIIDFEIKTGFKVSLDSFFKRVNGDKQRIAALENGRWLLPGFIQYQWFNKQQSFDLVLTNPMHRHIHKLLIDNSISFKSVRGLREVWKTSMDKDKELGERKGGVGEKKGEPIGSEKVKDFARQAWDDAIWRQSVCSGNYMGEDHLKRWMAQFNASVCNDVIPKFGVGSYKKMFGGWLNTQKAKGYKLDEPPKSKSSSAPLKTINNV